MTKIHPQGYRPWDDAQVKEILKREVIRDKKAEMIMAKLKGVNSIAAAQAKGAKVSTIRSRLQPLPSSRPRELLSPPSRVPWLPRLRASSAPPLSRATPASMSSRL